MRARILWATVAIAVAPSTTYCMDLIEVYRLALTSDPVLAQARANYRSAKERLRESHATFFPQLSFRASWQHKDIEAFADGGRPSRTYQSRSLVLALNQRIIDRSANHELAALRSDTEAAEALLEAERQKLGFRVGEAYLGALAKEDALRLNVANAHALKAQVDLATHRVEAGLAAVTEIYEATARYSTALKDRADSEVEAAAARDVLCQLAGQPPWPLKVLRETSSGPGVAHIKGQARVPRVVAGEYELAAAESRMHVARARRTPNLIAQLGYGVTTAWLGPGGRSATGLRHNGRQMVSAQLTLRIPLFEGTAATSRVRAAIQRRDTARDALDAARREVVKEIRKSALAVKGGLRRTKALAFGVASSDLAHQAALAGLAVGTRNFADVIAAETRSTKARMAYSGARHELAVARLRADWHRGMLDENSLRRANADLE